MIRINLGPAVARPPRVGLSRVVLAIGGAYLVLLGGLVGWSAMLNQQEAHLRDHVGILSQELTMLNAMRGRGERIREALADLTKRSQAIHDLTRGHGTAIRILEAFLDVVPREVWLTSLEGRGPELRAAGSALSARAVAEFMSNLRASGTFKEVEIVVARQELGKTPPAPVTFEVTCRFGT